MLIECLIKRPGGTVIELGKKTYHFKANDNGQHICEVKDKQHIARLLEINEGYAELKQEQESEPAAT